MGRAAYSRRTGLFNYGAEGLTGGASLRDGSAYGTTLLTGLVIAGWRDLRDEPPYGTPDYGTEALNYGRRLRDELPYGTLNYGTEGLAGRASLRDGGGGGAWDEPPIAAVRGSLITGRRDLREAPPYGTEALTGRLSLRDSSLRDGGTYGTSLLTGLLTTARRRSITGGAFGTSLLAGLVNTGREHSSIRMAVKGCLHVNHPKWYSKLENVLNPSKMLLGVVGAGSAALKRPDWRGVGTRH